jgi:transcriptional regulator of acetoin/glycerol metabolism
MARAAALGGDRIDVEDLSPHIATAPPVPTPSTRDSLEIKPRVEELERALVEEAMRQTNGNQTAAAKLLGLSRYGLQKKLKRYGISGSV